MCTLTGYLLIIFVLRNKWFIIEAFGRHCDLHLSVHQEHSWTPIEIRATLLNVVIFPVKVQWSCLDDSHQRAYSASLCCNYLTSSTTGGKWTNICVANTDPLFLAYSRRDYFRVEVTEGECQNTTAILKDTLTVQKNKWSIKRSCVRDPFEYTCVLPEKQINSFSGSMTWRLLTEENSELHTYRLSLKLATCQVFLESSAFHNVNCVENASSWQVSLRVNHSLLHNSKSLKMRCKDESFVPGSYSTGSHVVDLQQSELYIQDVNEERGIFLHGRTLTAILCGRSDDPLFKWTRIDNEITGSLPNPCSIQETTTKIPGWSHSSTCDLKFRFFDYLMFEPLIIRVTVTDNVTSIYTTVTLQNIDCKTYTEFWIITVTCVLLMATDAIILIWFCKQHIFKDHPTSCKDEGPADPANTTPQARSSSADGEDDWNIYGAANDIYNLNSEPIYSTIT